MHQFLHFYLFIVLPSFFHIAYNGHLPYGPSWFQWAGRVVDAQLQRPCLPLLRSSYPSSNCSSLITLWYAGKPLPSTMARRSSREMYIVCNQFTYRQYRFETGRALEKFRGPRVKISWEFLNLSIPRCWLWERFIELLQRCRLSGGWAPVFKQKYTICNKLLSRTICRPSSGRRSILRRYNHNPNNNNNNNNPLETKHTNIAIIHLLRLGLCSYGRFIHACQSPWFFPATSK